MELLIIRYGEIHLKKMNRPFFERLLLQNIRMSLKDFLSVQVVKGEGRIYVRVEEDRLQQAALCVSKVFGVHSLSIAREVPKDLEAVFNEAKRQMKDKQGTFKVLARRSDKRFPLASLDLAREAGARILDSNPRLTVDVHHPQYELQIEIRENAYIYVDVIPAVGGMPTGSNGMACLLLSGGIDSPVAGYMVAKRGVCLCGVHFHSFPHTGERAKEKAVELTRILSQYAGEIRLHIVSFTEIQDTIYEKCPQEELTIIMRRFMMRIAERIAKEEGAQALITGESIGQVASQTMDSLVTTDAVVQMPIFRPAIGMDKQEIVERARQIGSYETSILPYEDCCTVFVPKHPVTHPKLSQIEKSEEVLDIYTLMHNALKNVEILTIKAE